MSAILALLMRPLIEAAVSAFGQVLLDFFNTWRSREDAIALGHAEAVQSATLAAEKARDRMEDVMPMSDEEILRRLMEGKA
jgi:hypothetical protein